MRMIKKNMKLSSVFYCTLFLSSVVLAFLYMYWNIPSEKTMVSYSYVRVELMEEFMQIIRSGEIPQFLSAYEHSYGYAFYLPYIGVLFDIDEGWQLLLWVQLGAMTVLIVVLPFLIYKIFKNKFIAYMTPILLHLFCGNILYGFKTDSFWGMAWTIMLTFPLIYMLLEKGWERKQDALILVIGLICSVGNVMRNHNSFVTLVLVLSVLLYKFIRKEIKFLKLFLLVVLFYISYESLSTFFPLLLGTLLGMPTLNNEDFMWHAILCGWGYYPNEYGFVCSDEIILQLVQKYYPYKAYATDEYANSCKKLVFEILINDPGFVISTYLSKFFEMMKIVFKYLFCESGNDFFYFNTGRFTIRNIASISIFSLVIICGCFVKTKSVTMFRKYVPIIVFCVVGAVVGTAQALMMIPDLRYGLASTICVSMIPFYLCLIAIHIFTSGIRLKRKETDG